MEDALHVRRWVLGSAVRYKLSCVPPKLCDGIRRRNKLPVYNGIFSFVYSDVSLYMYRSVLVLDFLVRLFLCLSPLVCARLVFIDLMNRFCVQGTLCLLSDADTYSAAACSSLT